MIRPPLTPLLLIATVAGCAAQQPAPTPATRSAEVFRSGDCNLVSDDDVNAAGGAGKFTKVVVGDAGCFWQEGSMIGSFGVGMGISTWWYRGSDLDAERTLERKAGREITEVSLAGNSGFEASDENACSIYVAKGSDVITWSIQTMNPGSLPPLCTVIRTLAELSQERVN
ncbi:MAG: DUF3558 domain-containing protein [Candidatus Sericytochromatia bacterium]